MTDSDEPYIKRRKCYHCDERWPCDTAQLCALVERLTRERDQLREMIVTLIRLGLTDKAQENVGLFGRRLMRREPHFAEALRDIVPMGNILRGESDAD